MTLHVPPTSQRAREEGMRRGWMKVTGILKQIWTQECHRCAVISKVIEVISGQRNLESTETENKETC